MVPPFRLELEPKTGLQTPTHPYYARPWGWIPIARPISFYAQDVTGGTQQILAIGNPFIFWASLFAVPFVAFAWRRLRDWRAGFFYVLPLVPFMVLAVTYLGREASDATIVVREPDTGEVALHPGTGRPAISTMHVYRPFVAAYLIAVAAVFWLFWPILTAGRISDLHLRTIVWFRWWI